ncbi:MAG: sugar isomerase domain-containing protein [Pedosphaera sp.]|nr:sugar isomerase domain-containing protein [Pedosphaera sp.]
MSAYDQFIAVVQHQLKNVETTQRPAIEQAAHWVAEALARDRFLWAFGTGHSHMVAEEIFYRAGGLARGAPILEPKLMLHEQAIEATYLERRSGYAREILAQHPLAAGDVLVVASNSGRNAVPIEMALGGQALGLKVIGITNLTQSRQWPSRHASGKRLFEVVDLPIDTCGIDGDAAITLEGFPHRVGPPSSLTGLMIINLMVVQAIEYCVQAGHPPEVYISSNTQGDDHNNRLLEKYRTHIRHL